MGALLDKLKPFFAKVKDFFKKFKPFFIKIGAFFKRFKPIWDKIKAFLKKYMPIACRIALCVSLAFFTVYTVMVITDSDDYVTGFFEQSAYISFDEDIANAEMLASEHYDRLFTIASRLDFADSGEEVISILGTEYNNLIYLSNGAAYASDGQPLTADVSGYEEISSLAAQGAPACSEIYFDTVDRTEFIAFYVPVRGSGYVDGIVSRVELIDIIDLSKIRTDNTEALILMDGEGNVVAEDSDLDFEYSVGGQLRSFITSLTPDEAPLEFIAESLREGKRGNTTLSGNKVGYSLSLAPLSAFGDNIWIVNLTENEGLLSPELEYVRHIINICAIAIASLAISIIYVIVRYKKKYITESSKGILGTPEGCPNKEIFRINATKLLQNRERKFALAVFEIRQFRYISENISEKDVSELLLYITKVIQALCNIRETYGYLGDGKFGLLIHIESDRTVKDRVRLIESVASKNALLGASKSKRKFNIGLSLTFESQKHSFVELLGYAEIACEKAKNNIGVPYVVFNEQINNERMHNERIESEMETALATGEFKLFLQPKYNIETDKIDSAEALVRWFDTKTGDYRFPGEFIGLFESNGFITKLDHFMYIEALKYLSSAAERFDKVVPISVNVSMVTVSAPDFLDFYVENKKKYRVADNFIVIEFTESFAMEDYQKIRMIVDTLHENGIRCSLDDFGSGYSSLGTLKNIPFDELKFDRLFLSRGYNRENDDKMLATMFDLAKSMGIRVVQEGVETKEMFDSVVAKGCDVVQGYYYAKAIPVEEYRLFINSNTSIRYKSRVK